MRIFQKTLPLAFFLLSACTGSQNWKFDAIATGDASFDSARLIYADPKLSPLCLEIVRLKTGIEAFLSLARHRLTTPSEHPDSIQAEFVIDGEKHLEAIPLLEGRMRLRLSTELTERLIQALQDGKEIGILLDGFEQRVSPASFSGLFEKLAGSSDRFANFLKGPFE